ncbi:hypothetical protein [Gordonia malaquae]|uniref:hypothetical protein n=1 Tax=Gordonia malaquae TaxID=410332 RepID=UPI0030FF1EC1
MTAFLYVDQGWISVTGTGTTVTVTRSWLVNRHHDMYSRTEQFTRGCTLASIDEVDAPSDGNWVGARIIIETFDRPVRSLPYSESVPIDVTASIIGVSTEDLIERMVDDGLLTRLDDGSLVPGLHSSIVRVGDNGTDE